MNTAVRYPLLEKKKNRLSWSARSLVSGRIWYDEILCRIFPYTRCPNWLCNRMMDDPRACILPLHDIYRDHFSFLTQEKIEN